MFNHAMSDNSDPNQSSININDHIAQIMFI